MTWVDGSTLVFNADAWIYRSEVSYYQFSLCVEAGICMPEEEELLAMDEALLDPALANMPMQIEAQGFADPCVISYCQWAGGRVATEAESAAIGVDSGIPAVQTGPGFRCAVDSPHPMAAACQTSAFYVNGPPAPMDHSVTEAGHFCQNGQSFVTLDIAMPEGASIQSVNGDCQAMGDNRMLCSAAPGPSSGGEVQLQCNEPPAVQENGLPAAGEMQCLPGYEVNGDIPTECDFNKLLPAVQRDSGQAVAELQSSQDRLPGQVSLVVYQPDVKRQECGAGQYRDRNSGVCEDIPTCPSGMVFDGVAGCVIPSPTPEGGFPCPPGTSYSQVTRTCVPLVCAPGTQWNELTLTCEPGCVGGGGWDPVTGECYANEANAQLAPCPIGLFRGPGGDCVDLSPHPEPSNECLGGFHYDGAAQCCQTDLPSGRYTGCPSGQAFDRSTGACDSENIHLLGGKVLHTVEFSFDAPSCETRDNTGGDDGGGCNLSCPGQKLDPVTCSCY